MPERDGKGQGQNCPKQAACSGWFTRHSRLVTSGANLYPPSVWFAEFMLYFSGVMFYFYLNVTGRTKDRMAQNKQRFRAGSLVIVD